MEAAGDWLITDFDLTTGVQLFGAHDTDKVLVMKYGFQGNGRAWSSISSVARRPQRAAKR
jgi:hypothetical protein